MAKKTRPELGYKLGRICAWAFIPSVLMFYFSISSEIFPDSPDANFDRAVQCVLSPSTPVDGWSVASIICFCAVLITGLGSAATIIFAWPKERQRAIEARLMVEQLEQQCAQMRVEAARKRPGMF